MQLLEDVQADKENDILREIKQNVAKHAKWNEGYVDMTRAPLTPTSQSSDAEFRPAITREYLPTPPTSESSDRMQDVQANSPPDKYWSGFRQTTPSDEESSRPIPCFRRRVGRGGRVLIDRRNLAFVNKTDVDPLKVDRFKFDQDDDDDMNPVFEEDEFDIGILQHRAYLSAKARDQAVAQAQLQAQAQTQNGKRLQGSTLAPGQTPSNSTPSNSAAQKSPQNVS